MKSFFAGSIQHPVFCLILSLVIALPFLFFVPSVQTVDNVDYFTPEDDPGMVFYNRFKEVFGNDEFFVIAFQDQDTIFTPKNLSVIKDITEKLEGVDGVRDVISLSNVDDITGSEDYFLVERFLESIPVQKEALSDLKESAVSNNLYKKNIISSDARTTAITVFPHERPEDKQFRKRLVQQTMEILAPYETEHTFHLAGMTITNLRLSQFMKSDLSVFIPISYLVIILTMFLIFRDIKIVLISFCNISLCLGTTFGFIHITGATINNITSIIPSLIMVICLADTVHVFSKFLLFSKEYKEVPKALELALMSEYRPCLLTTVTTVIGFLSLSLSHLPPIKEFAFIAAFGVLSAYYFSFVFLPALIILLKPGRRKTEQTRIFNPLLQALANTAGKRPGIIVMSTVLFFGLSFAMLFNIKTETNLLHFFKEDTQLRQSIDFVEKHLSGVETIQISLKGDNADAFVDPVNIRAIESVHEFLSQMPEIDVVNSYVDFIKEMNKAFHNENEDFYTIPDDRNLVAQYLLLYSSDDMDDYMNSLYDHARIVARTAVHGSTDLAAMMETIEKHMQKNLPENISCQITGETKKVVDIVNYLVEGQISSIIMAFSTISLLMFFVMKSFKLGLISLVPNLFPICVNFFIMALFNIPLNTATSLISAIAIGIAVDDTIHFLYHYKKEFRNTNDVHQSIVNAFMVKGNALMTTSIILFAGFGVLVFSAFVPTIQFGLLTAMIIVSALMGDLVVAPGFIHFFSRDKKTDEYA